MIAPFPLLGITLLFWGWYVEQFFLAGLMAVSLEISRFLPWRWHSEDQDLYKVADFGTIILTGFIAYPYIYGELNTSLIVYQLSILPFAFFPLMLAQAYSIRGDFPLGGLFLIMRKKTVLNRRAINLDYPFFGICLISASTSNSVWYFPSILFLVGFALLINRPRRYHISLWLLFTLLTFALTYQAQQEFTYLHRAVGERLINWAAEWFLNPDPYQQNTAIGDIGLLKLSDQILLRVAQPRPWTMPLLLREATYNRLVGNSWHSPFVAFQALSPQANLGTWQLGDNAKTTALNSLKIYRKFSNDSAMLQSMNGTTRIQGLPALEVALNGYGAIKVKQPINFAGYQIFYDLQQSFDKPPEAADLLIPDKEKPALKQIADQLELNQLTAQPNQVLAKLDEFFLENFKYTLTLSNKGNAATPIARFLLEKRAGHCEYFATATVLLLRQAGIPARYAVGYSVSEAEGSLRIARKRHAHAWASAYINGTWQDVDNTPPNWEKLEEQANSSIFSKLTDLWSRLWFIIDDYRSTEQKAIWPWLLLVVILSVILMRRIFRGTGAIKKHQGAALSNLANDLSPFAQLELYLIQQGWPRGIGEPLGYWLQRIGRRELLPLLKLHYRDRYDPLGSSVADKTNLIAAIKKYLR